MFLRRFAIASTLIVGGAALAMPAMADVVNLEGVVDDASMVTSTPTSGPNLADDLNLYGEGTAQSDVVVKVADMALFTNSSDGVTLSASADGNLTNDKGTPTVVAYNVLIVADAAPTPAATAFTATSDSQTVNDFDANGDSARDLYIEYDAPALLDPGTYTSSITVTIADQ